MKSVGFKEWSVVCEALGRGLQSIILRKGGIAEGRAGFSFRHREFFLFPTYFHEQLEKVRQIDIVVPEPDDRDRPQIFFANRRDAVIRSWPVAEALESLHILQREVVQERFEDDRVPGMHVAFVRDISARTGLDGFLREKVRRLSLLGAVAWTARRICNCIRCS